MVMMMNQQICGETENFDEEGSDDDDDDDEWGEHRKQDRA